MMAEFLPYLRKKAGLLYLVYLALLPAIATFAVLWRYGQTYSDATMFLSFLVGTAAVGVYSAFVMSYQYVPKSLWRLLVLLLDGPFLIFVAQKAGTNQFGFAIDGYLVEGMVVWMSILLLASISPDPTPNQRGASVLIMLGAIAMTGWFFIPYIRAELLGDKVRGAWLLFAFVEGVVISPLLKSTEPQLADNFDESDFPWLIILSVMAWVIALFAGRAIAG